MTQQAHALSQRVTAHPLPTTTTVTTSEDQATPANLNVLNIVRKILPASISSFEASLPPNVLLVGRGPQWDSIAERNKPRFTLSYLVHSGVEPLLVG